MENKELSVPPQEKIQQFVAQKQPQYRHAAQYLLLHHSDHLDDLEKQAMDLRFNKEFSNIETAEVLNLTDSGVTRLFRGIRLKYTKYLTLDTVRERADRKAA